MARLAGVDEFGIFNAKQLNHIIEDMKIGMRLAHGPDIDLGVGSPDLQMIEAFAPEVRTLWAGMAGSFLQQYITTAQGVGLDAVGAMLRTPRILADQATGEATFSRETPAPGGGINIPAGSLIETEAGVRFSTDEAVSIAAGETAVSVAITASLPGANGNVGSGAINVLISNLVGVDAVTNADPTSGGLDLEADEPYRARLLGNLSGRGKATPNAIRAALAGVASAVHLRVNNDPFTTADDRFAEGTGAGTASQQADSADGERLGWDFVVPAGGKWIQDLEFTVNHAAGVPVVTVRIETDSGGLPSGALAHANLEKQGFSPEDGTTSSVHFTAPAFLAAGTYHRVLVPTAGSITQVGDAIAGGTDASFYDGASWATDTNIQNVKGTIIAGMKPHSVHAFITGGSAQDLADALGDTVGAGIGTNGTLSADFEDDSGNLTPMMWDAASEVPIYIAFTIVTDDDFDATAGPVAVKDAIIRYIGGTVSTGGVFPGLGLGEDVMRSKVVAAIQGIAGVEYVDLATLKIDTVDPPVSVAGNVAIDGEDIAVISDPADIDITVS